MLIPTLPDEALIEVRAHVAAGKLAVHRIVEARPLAQCQNCQDDGLVYVSLLGAGPAKQPIGTSKPSTYFPGDGYGRKGWYLIDRTASYPCPACSGQRVIPRRQVQHGPDVQAALAGLADAKRPRPVENL
jgi:hypothetical protein